MPDARLTDGSSGVPLDRGALLEAWEASGIGGRIVRVDVLEEKRKTVAYRLHRDGAGSVVAKRQHADAVRRERAMYEHIARLSLSAPEHLGFVESPDGMFAWAFLEDAGDESYSFTDRNHRRLGASWLGGLHSQSTTMALPPADLLERTTAADYRKMLIAAQARMAQWVTESANAAMSRHLENAVGLLAGVAERWDLIEEAWRAEPRAVTHGDFNAKNLRIGQRDGTPVLLVLDWEMAALAIPAVDLWWMAPSDEAIDAYSSRVAHVWPSMDRAKTRRAATLGTVLRLIAVLDWKVWDPQLWPRACGRVEEVTRAFSDLEAM
jgi:hypothetical protein